MIAPHRIAPHETPISGPAAACGIWQLRGHAFGALAMDRAVSYVAPENARSAAVAKRLGATRAADHDVAQVWVHGRPGRGVACNAASARVETQARQKKDAFKMPEKEG